MARRSIGTLDSSDKTIAILFIKEGGGHRPRNRKGARLAKCFYLVRGNNVMRVQLLEVSLLGIGTVLRLEKGYVVNGEMIKARNK